MVVRHKYQFVCIYNIKDKEADMVTNAVESDSNTDDLIKASESTLDFWDNEDDEVWDNVYYIDSRKRDRM
jgi:hypothetical protein